MSLVEVGRHWGKFLWERQERREDQLSLCSSLREHSFPGKLGGTATTQRLDLVLHFSLSPSKDW